MRTKMHADVAHPINSESRDYIQKEVVKSFTRELDLSQDPGYQAADIDEYHDEHFDDHEKPAAPASSPDATFGATAPPDETDPAAEEPSESEESSEPKQEDTDFGAGIV